MRFLIDFFPIALFVVAYKLQDIYTATGALVVVTGLQLLYSWLRYRRVEKMQLFTFVLVGFFGGLTVFFHNDAFIKWKVTIIYALFALALGVSQLLDKSILKSMLGKEMKVADNIWAHVTWYWVSFFAICGLVNIYVAFSLPLETWVNFKVFGLTALTLINTVITVFYLYKHLPEDQRKELK